MTSSTAPSPFVVWAPRAESVALRLDGDTVPMHPVPDGWWDVEATALPASEGPHDYGYLLDGSDSPLPDPRSRRQPDGVHGLSRTFDPADHRWEDGLWTGRQLAGGLIYELHIGTFTTDGTLDSAVEKLDHLVDLGVTHVELLPVNGFNGEHNWGYDGVAWYTVHEGYGGPAAYQRFVDACHLRGLAVVQDVVYNHLGPSGNYLPQFGPYLHDEKANTWGSSVNLDGPDSEGVRTYIIDNALMWLRDYHVDGLRLDAVHALVDSRATPILEEMAEQVGVLSAHLGRPLTLIAESDLNDPKLITERAGGGYGLDAQWSDDFHHVLHVALTGETTGYYADFGSMSAIAKVLTHGFYHDGTWSSFRGRNHGRPVNTAVTPTSRFVVFLQDHDQIGNRAIGDRLTSTLTGEQLALGATLLMTSGFTPMLFMGEEWGARTPWQFFTSHPEADLGEATAKGRIEEFARMGWDPAVVPDPQDPSTFENSKLDWSELDDPEQAGLLAVYRTLARVRRRCPELTDPRFGVVTVDFDDDEHWLLVNRGGVQVVANFSAADQELLLPGTAEELVFASGPGVELRPAAGGRPATVVLPGHRAAILTP
ncbi:malto-oligosyltrehalose trehalohydrolase [Nakamurella silvestris]|nr:malto-oligosyltrehalose trehalohydrolase [Nakamurella silvestris]